MDTNALALLLQNMAEMAARQKAVVGPLGPNSVIITGLIIAAIPGVIGSIVSGIGLVKTKNVERTVNGDRVRMAEEMKQKDLRLVELEKSKAVLEEKSRIMAESQTKVAIQSLSKAEGKAEGKAELESEQL